MTEITKLRSDIFAILRKHDVSEQCFAEVAIVTQAAVQGAGEAATSEEHRNQLYDKVVQQSVVDGWREKCEALEADNASLTDELAKMGALLAKHPT